MKTTVWPWLIGLAVVTPISWQLMQYHGKPVDIVVSDLLILLILLFPANRPLEVPAGVNLKQLAVFRVVAVLFMAYCLWLSMSAVAGTSELARMVTAVKLIKPIGFVVLGTYLAATVPPIKTLKRVASAFALVSLATMGTAIVMPGFPNNAWGANLFAFPVYGYRNSAMSFYGVMVPLLWASADTSPPGLRRLFFQGTAGMTALMVISSLSRSSTIAMIFAIAFYLCLTGRAYVPVAVTVLGIVMGTVGFGLSQTSFVMENDVIHSLHERIERRLSQTVGAEDPLSGRGGIWRDTLELAAERPIFGYAFEPYSHYSYYGTPHQQYLEVLFKTGGLGLLMYLWLLLSGMWGVHHLARHAAPRTEPAYYLKALLATTCAVMVGNLSQPNLTYSIIGNCIFFLLGLMLNRHGAAALTAYYPAEQDGTPITGSQWASEASHPLQNRAKAA